MLITYILLVPLLWTCHHEQSSDFSYFSQSASDKSDEVVQFQRTSEPNEKAFSFLLPKGWHISGGITRIGTSASAESGNAIEAKLYMKLLAPDARAEMGWLPDTRFFDKHRYFGQNPAAPMFPNASNNNGLTAMNIMSPADFVCSVATPFAHPHAMNVQITKVQKLPEMAEEYRQMSALMFGECRFIYIVAIVTLEYTENNKQYLEKMVCTIEDQRQLGTGIWANKETWYVRAEKSVFETNIPLFETISNSIKLSSEWLSRETYRKLTHGNHIQQTQHEFNKFNSEIAAHRLHINSEINYQMFQNLSEQYDFTNPFTGETERGSNHWNYRWENNLGDVIYHNNSHYNPNDDAKLSVKGFRQSVVRN